MNGGAPNQGRVEVHHEGQWGTVCDDLWDDADATVVCGQLGYDVGTAVGLAHFGRGDGPILLDSVQCEGGEASIEQCPHDPWGEHDCSHAEDAGAICSEYIRMMTSWNGNIFRVTGPLWGESTGGFPSQMSVARSFDVFFDLRLNNRLGKQSIRRWFKTPSSSLWRHYNVNSNQCSLSTVIYET